MITSFLFSLLYHIGLLCYNFIIAQQKEKLGYKPDETPEPNHMDAYYSRDEQEKYGVIGIEIR